MTLREFLNTFELLNAGDSVLDSEMRIQVSASVSNKCVSFNFDVDTSNFAIEINDNLNLCLIIDPEDV